MTPIIILVAVVMWALLVFSIWATTTVKTWRPNAVQELSEQEVKEYATRYKWLRDASNNQKERILSKTADCWGIYLDQAIDKAMKEEADESSNKIQNQ